MILVYSRGVGGIDQEKVAGSPRRDVNEKITIRACLNGIFVGVVLQRSHYGHLTTLVTVQTSKLATYVIWVIVNTFLLASQAARG